MCDCFHLAFPNWHAPAAGAGRRLTGPEQDAEDDSVCEEPEILERERPRPQGSSPVEEFPVEKQAEEDIAHSAHKTGSNKKGRKAGFGSLFDKRTSDKIDETEIKLNEDMQSGEPEMIVKTVKEACVEGLVVTGGGKEGIFIKEVKLDSPASKHLSVKEGDQILSATVYFDNVSYEDALQILEHAQPYKMEFCLRRRAEPTIPENVEIIHPKEKEQGSPVMRSERKMRKQQERISWPKFPSFGKGPRVQFRRSHSTSEAEEHRKLEMSPPTSDTDSPLKSPLKSPDGKDKKKKHKVQLKMKMKGHRSKSVEEPQRNEKALVWENQQVEDILEEKVSEGHEGKMQDIPQVLDGAKYEASSKTENDDPFQISSGMGLHEAHLISLGNTLKTTDISVALAEGGKIESSEMKVRIHQKEKPNIGSENQAETIKTLYTVLDPSACDNVVLSQAEVEISQLDNDFSKQGIGKDSSEKKLETENAELSMPNLDTCVGVTKKSPMFENESYGIRTRGPLADMATSKTHFASPVNGLQFISSDFSDITQVGKMSHGISDAKKPTVIFQPKPGSTIFAVDKEGSTLEIKTSKLPTETTDFIQADIDETSASKFKLPKVDGSGFVTHELIKMTEAETIRALLPKREDIEIPGMENKETKPSLQSSDIKVPKIDKIINIRKEREIQDAQTDEEFNIEDVKVAVSKFPAFKLPERDITGVLVQREITIMELKSDKSMLTPRGSPHKISITSTDSTSIPKSKVGEVKSPASDSVDKDTAIKMPTVELPYIDEQSSTAVIKIDYTQPHITDYGRLGDINFKLPKREDIEIPGMEAIKETKLQNTVIKEVNYTDLDHAEKTKTKKYSDKKGHEKKSKKPKITIQESEIAKPDFQSPDISTELPKKDSSKMDTGETKINERHKFKSPKIGGGENIDVLVQEAKILEDNMDKINLPQKTETKFGKTKFKIPTITLPEFGTKVPRGAVDISVEDVQVKEPEIILPEDKLKLKAEPLLSDLDGTDVNKDGQSVGVYGRALDTDIEGQGKKFKLPKFEISFPEVKAPKIICTSKKDDDSSVSEETGEVPVMHSPKAELPYVKPDMSSHLPEVDSEITEVKIKRPGFSFPRFGISKSEHIVPAADVSLSKVDMSLPEGHREMEESNRSIAISVKDGKQKDATKFGSPTKFKIPSIKFPNFGGKVTKAAVESTNVDVDVDVNEAKISLPELKSSGEAILIDIKEPEADKEKKSVSMDIQSEVQGSKFKLPKSGISLPEVKKKAGTPEVKLDLSVDLDKVKIPKTAGKISDVDVKATEISLPDAEMKLSAEPLTVDIKVPDADKEIKLLSLEMKDQDIQIKAQESKFKLPKFGISLPEIRGPKFEGSSDKTEIDISVPKAMLEVHAPDTEVQGVTAEMKADLPEIDSKDIEMKMKTPGFSFPGSGFSKSEVKAPEGDVSLPNIDLSLPEGSIEIEKPATDVEQKGWSKLGSPTKFKLPSINLPKFGIKSPEALVGVPDVDVDVKGPEISLPDAEMKLSAEPLTVDIKVPDADKETKTLHLNMKDQDIQIKEQDSKFKLPKFGISLPEIKGPKFDISSDKTAIDISVPKATVEVHPPDVEVQGVKAEMKADLPEIDSKDIEMKMKTPGFSFPKIGFSKSEVKAPEGDVSLPNAELSLPEGSAEIEKPATDAAQKDQSKLGSPTKFKLPSINLPKFGIKGPEALVEVPDVDVDVKGAEISLPEVEMKLSAEPLTVDIKVPDTDEEMKPLSLEMKDQDIQIKEQDSKFKLPKFGISLLEIKGPKFDVSSDKKAESDVSVPKATVEVHPPDVEVQGVTAIIKGDLSIDSKDTEMKMKTPGFSFPGIGFSKSEVKAPEGDVNLPNVDVSFSEGSTEIEKPATDVTIPKENAEQKGRSKFGSPTKFKFPSINLPKFGIKGPKASVEVSGVDADVKGPEISLPDAEMKLSAEPLTVDIKVPDADKEMKPLSLEMKDQDIQIKEQDSKFKLPKFGISLPEIKGPKFEVSSDKGEIDISVPKATVEVHPPDVEVQGVTTEMKADLPEIDSKDIEMKMKTPGFSFPKIGFSKSEVKAPEGDVSLPDINLSLPEGIVEIERPATDVTIPKEDAEQKGRSKFGSPTKFKLPSINLPKFGIKGSKASVEVSGVDADVKGPEISLPDAEMKLSAEPLTVDIKVPDGDKEMKPLSLEMKDQDIQIKEQDSKFKLPKFGIGLPEIKGPKFDSSSDKAKIDISVPKATVEVCPPDVEVQGVKAEMKADFPEIDSKDIEMKMKTPGFSFPRIEMSKSEVKAPEGDVSLLNADVSFPEGSVEIEKSATDVTIPKEDAEQKGRSKFGSPTKFKFPSINLPKFGIKGSKASVEVSDVDVDVKGPDISLPDTEMKLSAKPLTVDIKVPDIGKEIKPLSLEMKDQDIQIKEKESKFKLPKFGISLPEIKGPKFDVSSDKKAEIDISVPKATVEVHPPDVEVQGVTATIKGDLSEIDSKDTEMKMKTPGFSFPGIGFSKSEVKAPEGDVNLPNVDVSFPEGSIEIKKPATDVTIPMKDAEQKGRSKFGSPTKFKLPSINLPKFGIKGPKASVEVSDVDVDVTGPEISLPDAEMKLSSEPLTVDIKVPDAEKEMKPLSLEMKDQDIQIKEQDSKFKLPKFGISLPEIKGPKFDVTSDKKAEIDFSVPKATVEVHPPDVEVQGVTATIKGDLSEIDSKDTEMKMKTPGFSFPRIGFNKSEVKAPEGDVSLPNVESFPEGSIEIEKPATDVTIPKEDAEQKGRSKFGSPTKFKLPSINLPKFGIKGPKTSVEVSDVDLDVTGPEISLPDAEMKLSSEPLTVDIKVPDADKEMKPLSLEMKDQDIQIKEQESKFKLPKFGIGLPEIKGPKFDVSSDKAEIDISVPKAMVEVHPPDVEVQGVTAEMKADLPEVDSKDIEMKMKTPGFSFPKIGFSKSEVKAPEGDVSLPNVDLSLPEGNVEIERPATDVTVPREDAEQKGRSKFGSPTKFKFPSISLPKFGIKGPKASVEVSDVDVDVTGPEISLPDAEMKLTAEPLTVDIKVPDADKEMKPLSLEMKDRDLQIKEQESKFKLPKFGISLPEIKGPIFEVSSDKAEIDISVPKAMVEVHPPDVEVQGVTAEMKADLPEIDSKDIETKMKTPGFSFPKTGFSKSEVKAPEGEVSLPNVDLSLPEGNVEIERPATDVTVPKEDAEQKGRSKFGSPTKFKFPSISLPKFGIKGPKAPVEVSDVDVDVTGPEISLPDAEMKLTAEPLTVDIKVPDADKEMKPLSLEMKDRDLQIKEQESKFKLPKFGISLPEIKGPIFEVSSDKAEIDISVPKAMAEVHPPDVEVQGVTAEMKADLPEIDSKDIETKMRTPGFSFPKTGFSKSEVKAPEGEVSLPNVDLSLPEGNVEIERPATDVTIPKEDAEQKGRSKFGSPTKFKFPSINLPKFGIKGPKASAEVSHVDVDVTGPEISLPDAEMKLSAEPLTVDIKKPDVDKEMKPLSLEMKDQDIQIKDKGSKFKLPKFEIGLPEIKGPKFEISSDKAVIDISAPKAMVEVHPPDVQVQGVTAEMKADLVQQVQDVTAEVKSDLPEVDSKHIDLKMKRPGLSFPRFSKSESKAPASELSLQSANVSLAEESIKVERPTTDNIESLEVAGQKDPAKSSSQTKLKLPSLKFPKFGVKVRKETIDISSKGTDIKGPDISLSDADLSAEPLSVDIKGHDVNKDENFGVAHPKVKGPEINIDGKGSSKPESSIYLTEEVKMQSLNNKVKNLEISNEVAIPELDSQVGKCEDEDTVVNYNVLDVTLEPTQKNTQEVKTPSKFILPTLDDVFRGFGVEFNVPKFDEIEGAKKKYSDPQKQDNNIAVRGQVSTSPTKTAKDDEKVTSQLPKKDFSPPSEANLIELKKSFIREADEDTVSPTLSLSSSDAFADVSSALTTEQIGPSLASPTKVKVKYSEPTANAEVSDLHGDIITSTARTELISLEPHQPEKVNIPFSSETSSSSLDTLKQMSGHIVVSNMQSVSKTEHAFFTKVDTQDTQTFPTETVGDSMLSVEETIMRKGHTIVEKHVVKEIFGDDKEKIFVTQRIQVFEGDSTEPISDDTASSIQKLRDTVHTEKIRFFEGAESSKTVNTVLMNTETLLRHADSSTDENEGK